MIRRTRADDDLEYRMEYLQTKAGIQRGMLRLHVNDAATSASALLQVLHLGLLGGRLAADLLGRHRGR